MQMWSALHPGSCEGKAQLAIFQNRSHTLLMILLHESSFGWFVPEEGNTTALKKNKNKKKCVFAYKTKFNKIQLESVT